MSARPLIAALRLGVLPLLATALSLATAACAPAPGSAAAGNPAASADSGAAQRFTDREEIEHVLSKANIGFELSDPDMFANAFAEDAVYELASDKPVFGYQKLRYEVRADIRTIYEDELVKHGSEWLIAKRRRIE